MSQGQDNVTETKRVITVFDPFIEVTTKYYKPKVNFKTGAGARVELSLINIEDANRNIIRLHFDTTIDGEYTSDAYMSGVVSDFILNVDGEVIKCNDKSVRNNFKRKDVTGKIIRYTNSGWFNFSLEDAAKVVGSDNIEARFYSAKGYTDLDDKTESKIVAFMREFTDEVIQSDDFKEAFNEKIKLNQEIEQARIAAAIEANGENDLTPKPSLLWRLIKWSFFLMAFLTLLGLFLG
jgi:hypothetical protein